MIDGTLTAVVLVAVEGRKTASAGVVIVMGFEGFVVVAAAAATTLL